MTTVGLWGTFDIDNYGDRLFPLIATSELQRRIAGLEVRTFGPLGSADCEPLGEWSPHRASQLAAELDAIVIGGGEIIHFNDPMLAPVYRSTPEELDRINPTAFFVEALGPALERRCPVLWNALGVPTDPTPDDARRLRAALVDRAYVSVRDARSLERLSVAGVSKPIHLVPDSALLVDRLLPEAAGRDAQERLRRQGELPPDGPFVVIQGCDLLVPHAAQVAAAVGPWLERHPGLQPVLVETGPCRGDGLFADAVAPLLGGRVTRIRSGVELLDIAAAIAGSAGFIGSSLHGCITAAAFGRPFLILNFAPESKLFGFGDLLGRPDLVIRDGTALPAALDGLFATPCDASIAVDLKRRVDVHFDRMASIIGEASSRRPRRPTRSRFRLRRPAPVRS